MIPRKEMRREGERKIEGKEERQWDFLNPTCTLGEETNMADMLNTYIYDKEEGEGRRQRRGITEIKEREGTAQILKNTHHDLNFSQPTSSLAQPYANNQCGPSYQQQQQLQPHLQETCDDYNYNNYYHPQQPQLLLQQPEDTDNYNNYYCQQQAQLQDTCDDYYSHNNYDHPQQQGPANDYYYYSEQQQLQQQQQLQYLSIDNETGKCV
ncbi:vacuolar protein-sorting-associated protein 36-like [Portunus trituberculatus]|uniref:vacuolar protein-sorting-associated protein 36-like n=1 Tax=Portunus trituberculatus TaxID=210409 RepID=UPI001E1CF232|nr:vacuolar protein-sorting-associated protein 36-like [Portunus trituberculatus]